MMLTGKELEIMTVLWDSETPLTTSEIIECTPHRTWQEGSIFAIMNTLIKKGAVVLETYKPTLGKHARAYKPLITSEEYAIASIDSLQDKGIRIDIDKLVDGLLQKKEVRGYGEYGRCSALFFVLLFVCNGRIMV